MTIEDSTYIANTNLFFVFRAIKFLAYMTFFWDVHEVIDDLFMDNFVFSNADFFMYSKFFRELQKFDEHFFDNTYPFSKTVVFNLFF